MAPLHFRPCVALLHDEAVAVEVKKGRAGERLQSAVLGGDDRPPVDSRSHSVHDGLPEPALGGVLAVECPSDVLRGCLRIAKRVGVEGGVRCIQLGDSVDVCDRPRTRPDGGPAPCGVPRVYFATSIARLSRMTMTFTWPGYSS